MRGATTWPPHFPASVPHFNPRTPCGVRPNPYRLLICSVGISIHAPRAGCDLISSITKAVIMISIHAPRAGCDSSFLTLIQFHKDFNPRTPCGVRLPSFPTRRVPGRHFNPRTPCGVRHGCTSFRSLPAEFQSTHPVRGATDNSRIVLGQLGISIHAPRAGCDGKFDGFTRPNLRKRYKKVSVQPKKRAKKKIKEMLCSHSHIFGWISGAKVPEFPVR